MIQFIKKLFQTKEADTPLCVEDVEKIIQEYGNHILINNSPPLFKSTKELPYPKQKIKLALSIAIKLTSDPEVKEQLKSSYVSLADWQDGITPDDKFTDFSKIDINSNPQDLAKDMLKTLETDKKWAEIVKTEAEQLYNEIKDL